MIRISEGDLATVGHARAEDGDPADGVRLWQGPMGVPPVCRDRAVIPLL